MTPIRPHYLLALLALVPLSLLGLPGAPRQQGLDASTASCATCHVQIHDEWKQTLHAKAWVDEIYQAAIKQKRKPSSCWACHIPLNVLDRAPRKPKYRAGARDDGIHCAACHVSDNKVHGPYGARTDAHSSVKSPLFAKDNVDLCLSCHRTKIGPVLPIGRDFEHAKLAEKGKSCVGCHMPEVERPMAADPKTGKPAGPKRKGRSHELLGPSNKEFLAKAFSFTAERKDGKLVLALVNEAGHRVPGMKIRAFKAKLTIVGANGKELWSKERTFTDKDPLQVLESWTESVGVPEGAAASRAEVEHLFDGGSGLRSLGKVFDAEK